MRRINVSKSFYIYVFCSSYILSFSTRVSFSSTTSILNNSSCLTNYTLLLESLWFWEESIWVVINCSIFLLFSSRRPIFINSISGVSYSTLYLSKARSIDYLKSLSCDELCVASFLIDNTTLENSSITSSISFISIMLYFINSATPKYYYLSLFTLSFVSLFPSTTYLIILSTANSSFSFATLNPSKSPSL